MRAVIDLATKPPTIGAPAPALELKPSLFNGEYDLDPSGKRILVLKVAETEDTESRARIHLAINWFDELERVLSSDGGPP